MDTGWLKDKLGNKIAPKTLISQVQDASGVLLQTHLDSINQSISEIKNQLDIDISEIAELVGGDA